MKYTMRENPDGTHTLLRYGEPAVSRGGMPTNAELEFWFEIERLREANREWRNSKESLPAVGEQVVCWDECGEHFVATFDGECFHVGLWGMSHGDMAVEKVPYWRPLPWKGESS